MKTGLDFWPNYFKIIVNIINSLPDVVVHVYNPSTQQAKAGGSRIVVNSGQTWTTK